MNIEKALKDIINAKEGNKELAIFYCPDQESKWSMSLGNYSNCVMLGEIPGEIEVEADSFEDVICAMEEELDLR